MKKEPIGTNSIKIELTEAEEARLKLCQSAAASEDQVRAFIATMIDIRKRHYMKKCEIQARDAAVVQDTVQEQMYNKNMQDLIGEIWAEIITRAVNASIAGKVPGNYMLNAILHASTEAAVMAIESYNIAHKTSTGESANTAKLTEDFAVNIGKSILECARSKGLI